MARTRLSHWGATVAPVPAMAGCTDGIDAGPEPEVDPDPPQTSLPSPNDPTGPDPDEPGEARPAVSLPGLPIDGTADLAAGVAVRVTGFRFTPDAFVVSAWGCDDSRPACAGSVFTAQTQLCNLAVAPRPDAGAVANPLVSLTGELSCRQLQPDVCLRFATEAAACENTNLELLPLAPSTGNTNDPTTTSSDDPTEGPSESPGGDPSGNRDLGDG